MPLAQPAVLLIEGDGGLQLWKKIAAPMTQKVIDTHVSLLFAVLCLVCLVLLAEGVCSPRLLKCTFTVSIPGALLHNA